jgi:hypothetical protein
MSEAELYVALEGLWNEEDGNGGRGGEFLDKWGV